MVIKQLTGEELLACTREALGLPVLSKDLLSDDLFSALLRKTAGVLCPCAPSTLVTAVLDSLEYLIGDRPTTERRLEELVEKLVVIGDLLELNDVTSGDPNAKSTWVFVAPPAFVRRPDDTMFLLGIAPELDLPLPPELLSRVLYDGPLRILAPETNENLGAMLVGLGYREVPSAGWIKAPRHRSADQLYQEYSRRLDAQPPSGSIADLTILDSTRDCCYYTGRWGPAMSQTGVFVARRPQAYGSPLWGLVSLRDGEVQKLLDFPLNGSRWRGCDTAWHLQMAIDALRGKPQRYRSRVSAGGEFLDFFSPLPLWAERRLAVFGHPVEAQHCLLTYWIPAREAPSETAFLEERLWLRRLER